MKDNIFEEGKIPILHTVRLLFVQPITLKFEKKIRHSCIFLAASMLINLDSNEILKIR